MRISDWSSDVCSSDLSVQTLNPPKVCAPVGPYSQSVLTTGSGRWLHIAGQVGVRQDGALASGFAEQVDVAWTNIQEILKAAGMKIGRASCRERVCQYV